MAGLFQAPQKTTIRQLWLHTSQIVHKNPAAEDLRVFTAVVRKASFGGAATELALRKAGASGASTESVMKPCSAESMLMPLIWIVSLIPGPLCLLQVPRAQHAREVQGLFRGGMKHWLWQGKVSK